MKSTGIVRKVDPVGRMVIPKELRRLLKLTEGTPMEIVLEEELIVIKRYDTKGSCIVTGEVSDENREFAPGLILSPKGAELVLQQLQSEGK